MTLNHPIHALNSSLHLLKFIRTKLSFLLHLTKLPSLILKELIARIGSVPVVTGTVEIGFALVDLQAEVGEVGGLVNGFYSELVEGVEEGSASVLGD